MPPEPLAPAALRNRGGGPFRGILAPNELPPQDRVAQRFALRVFAGVGVATGCLLLTDRVLAHRVDITDAVHVMTPVIVTSATLLVVIAVLAALFPLDTQVAPGAFETIGVATTAIIGNHCVREWPERQGEAAHTAPVRRVVMLSILAVVCAVLVLFASGRLRSPWLGCRVIAAAIGGFDIAHTAWLQLQWHYYPESMPSLDTPIMYTTGERRGPPTLKAYAPPPPAAPPPPHPMRSRGPISHCRSSCARIIRDRRSSPCDRISRPRPHLLQVPRWSNRPTRGGCRLGRGRC